MRDVSAVLRHYLHTWHAEGVVLIGLDLAGNDIGRDSMNMDDNGSFCG